MRSWGWSPQEWDDSPYKRDPQRAPLTLSPGKDTERRRPSAKPRDKDLTSGYCHIGVSLIYFVTIFILLTPNFLYPLSLIGFSLSCWRARKLKTLCGFKLCKHCLSECQLSAKLDYGVVRWAKFLHSDGIKLIIFFFLTIWLVFGGLT